MADVLSQNEIDALLSALSTGELQPDELPKDDEKQKVKVYDFKSPNKFSKDHIRTLEMIHDNYSRIIANYLTGQLRTNVKMKIESVEQITYEEFIHSVPNPTILTIFKMPPLSGSLIFETNPQFVYEVIDILLGGAGGGTYKLREFTDIDKNIITQINKGLISNLKMAWEDILDVDDTEIEAVETNPTLNQTLAPNEPVALITFSAEIEKNSSFINICIPYLSIEKILDKLIVQYWFQENNEKLLEDSRIKLRRRLNIVEVPISAVLGSTKITVDEFLKLAVGDVVAIDRKNSSAIDLYVGEEACYYVKPGVVGKNLGIQILDIINKDVENYE